jgi:NAD(P)-dependent dehydrogenase (short-subunit alcohol dehydrogenase family)
MELGLKGKVAIITGGNHGVGEAVARGFADEGVKVVIVSRGVEQGEKVAKSIQDAGGEALFVQTDVTKEEDVKRMVEQTMQAFGRLDIAFNGAGAVVSGLAAEYTVDDYHKVLDTNVMGVWLCMKYQIQAMLNNGKGAIMNVASGVGHWGCPDFSFYATSKHAVEGLSKSVAADYGKRGIRVNSLCPGPVNTDLFQQVVQSDKRLEEYWANRVFRGFIATPEEMVGGVLWACSDKAAFFTGQALAIDGGLTSGFYPSPLG